MKARIKATIKQSRLFYLLYYHIGSFLLRIWGVFIKTDPDLVLYVSYGGKKYDDSPKVIYEYMKNDPAYSKYKHIWAFVEPEEHSNVENKVKVDTLAYYYIAMKAGYWITNSSASRGLRFKKKKTKNYLFQHGMAGIKKFGADIQETKGRFISKADEKFDAIFIEGKKEVPLLVSAWKITGEELIMTGLPRNDDLACVTETEIEEIKAKLGLPKSKKIILYAPTYRELTRLSDNSNALSVPIDFRKWKDLLGKEYVLLVTAHYEVAKLLDELPDDNFVYNAFKYPVLNDLIKISDVLITDYSSIVFDYAIMERPIFCYAYDYDTYERERGFYTDLNTLFSNGVLKTEQELLNKIVNMDYCAECSYTKRHIKNEYVASYGNAAQKAVAVIFGEG